MNEAPKKIWVPESACNGLAHRATCLKETPYIRADIVDELVAALKWIDVVNAMEYEYRKVARAALAKLEDV